MPQHFVFGSWEVRSNEIQPFDHCLGIPSGQSLGSRYDWGVGKKIKFKPPQNIPKCLGNTWISFCTLFLSVLSFHLCKKGLNVSVLYHGTSKDTTLMSSPRVFAVLDKSICGHLTKEYTTTGWYLYGMFLQLGSPEPKKRFLIHHHFWGRKGFGRVDEADSISFLEVFSGHLPTLWVVVDIYICIYKYKYIYIYICVYWNFHMYI